MRTLPLLRCHCGSKIRLGYILPILACDRMGMTKGHYFRDLACRLWTKPLAFIWRFLHEVPPSQR